MTATTRADAEAILRRGEYAILRDYALRDEILPHFREAFLTGVEALAGTSCRQAVERDGLARVHEHFPVEKLPRLEEHILGRMRDRLYFWSYAVGAQNLGLPHPFYVDYLIVIRIHYPFAVARRGGKAERPAPSLREKTRLALAAAREPRMLANHLAKSLRQGRGRDGQAHAYDARSFHGDLPTPARAHAAHVDTWYGHSYDGINLWLSIEGVNRDNTIILYPEMFGRRVDFDPKSMYLAPGIAVPPPTKVALAPGELLLFNPEMLHGTQVNVSPETRVALTTRINPHAPRFNVDAPFNFEHWFSSEDLAARRFARLRVFPADRHRGEPSILPATGPGPTATRRILLAAAAPQSGELELCASAALQDGDSVAVDGADFRLLLSRTTGGLRAYDRRCPHRGVDLADGAHDAARVYCPGHGVEFALADGHSVCPDFSLRAWPVAERGGRIYLLSRTQAAVRA